MVATRQEQIRTLAVGHSRRRRARRTVHPVPAVTRGYPLPEVGGWTPTELADAVGSVVATFPADQAATLAQITLWHDPDLPATAAEFTCDGDPLAPATVRTLLARLAHALPPLVFPPARPTVVQWHRRSR